MERLGITLFIICLCVVFTFSYANDKYQCISVSDPTWLNPKGKAIVYQGETSWIEFPVQILSQSPDGRSCKWIKRIKFKIEVNAKSALGQINVYNVEEAIRSSTQPKHYGDNETEVAVGTEYLWTDKWESNAPKKQLLWFFIQANEKSRVSKQKLEFILRASICDHTKTENNCANENTTDVYDSWIDREALCSCISKYNACKSAGMDNCLHEKEKCDKLCEKRIKKIYQDWIDLIQGPSRQIPFDIKEPYIITLKPQTYTIGSRAVLEFSIKNTGIENLVNVKLIIKIPEDLKYFFIPDLSVVDIADPEPLGGGIIYSYDLEKNEGTQNIETGDNPIVIHVPFEINTTAWAGTKNIIETRLSFAGYTTGIIPETQFKRMNPITLKGTEPSLTYTLINPKTKLPYEKKKGAKTPPIIQVLPLERVTLHYTIRNDDPRRVDEGYLHNCEGKLTIPANTMNLKSIKLIKGDNITEIEYKLIKTESLYEYRFYVGDFDREEIKEYDFAFKINRGPSKLINPIFEILNCKKSDKKDYISRPILQYILNRTALELNVRFSSSYPIKSYKIGDDIKFQITASNPTHVDFGVCEITVIKPPGTVFKRASLNITEVINNNEVFNITLKPQENKTFEYTVTTTKQISAGVLRLSAKCNGKEGVFLGEERINLPPVGIVPKSTPVIKTKEKKQNPFIFFIKEMAPFLLVACAMILLLIIIRAMKKKKIKDTQETKDEKKTDSVQEKTNEQADIPPPQKDDSALEKKIDSLLSEVTSIKEKDLNKRPKKADLNITDNTRIKKQIEQEKILKEKLEKLAEL